MNATDFSVVEKELKKLKIYEYFHDEWSRIYYRFILEWTDSSQLEDMLLRNLVANENMSLSLIREILPYHKRNIAGYNPHITLEFIKEHSDLPWDFTNISQFTEKISFEEMFEFYKMRHEHHIQGSESICLEFMHDLNIDRYMHLVDTCKEYHFSPDSLKYNTTITMKDYLKYRHHPFFTTKKTVMVEGEPWKVYFDASSLRTLTVNDYLNNDDYPWKEQIMKSHINRFTYEDYLLVGFILPNEPVDELYCIYQPRFDYIQKYPHYPWHTYCFFVQSPLVTLENVLENSHLSWNMDYLLLNPNLTFDYLRKNKNAYLERYPGAAFYDDFYCKHVIRNKFTVERVNWILQKITENYIKSNIYFELKMKTWSSDRIHDWCGVEVEE